MGWQSELEINRLLVGVWHNHGPSWPALLFRGSDLKIIPASDPTETDSVYWSTTAANALENLRASGFTWEHLLRDYSECRDNSLEAAFLQGVLLGQGRAEEYASLMEVLRLIEPAEDLAMLARAVFDELNALRSSWTSEPMGDDPPTPIRDCLLFDEWREHHHIDVGESLPMRERFVLTRALEYFVRNSDSGPLVGWAFALIELLHHVEPDALVEFDVAGGLRGEELSSQAYADEYWRSAQSDLAYIARFYGTIFTRLESATSDVARAAQFARLEELFSEVVALGANPVAKGQSFEALVAAMLELPGTRMPILEKRLRHADEELDLVLRNDLDEPFWRNFNSPVILVECKNWVSRVGVNELKILETKMRDRARLCSVGLFVSMSGFSQPFLDRVRDLHGQGQTVFPISGYNLQEIIRQRLVLSQWLKDNGIRVVL